MSLRSKSPDDNSSLLSASSLDSALNHSREEEELRGLTMDQSYDDPNDEIEKVFSHSKWKPEILSVDQNNHSENKSERFEHLKT